MSARGLKPPATLAIEAITAMAVIGLAALSAVLAVIAARDTCSGTGIEATPSAGAKRGIPARYLSLYRQAGGVSRVPWTVLAAIGSIETDHGRSRAPGVRSGVNHHGCCAGPMQFNLRDDPPSTWERYGVDANHDGSANVYDPEDAIPSAATYLAALRRANGNLNQAILGYNHSAAYVRDVLARARAYARDTDEGLSSPVDATTALTDCVAGGLSVTAGPANLRAAQHIGSPPSTSARLEGSERYRHGPWPAPGHRARSTPASTTTSSGSCGATTCASAPPARPATTPTATAPPSTSSPPTAPRRRSGTPRPAGSPTTSAGRRRARARAPAPPAGSRRPFSSSAMTGIRAMARRAPAAAPAPRTCTCPGRHRATARAALRRPASG